MEIVVQCYGNVREAVTADRTELTVETGATVADVLDRLAGEYTDLEGLIDDEDTLVVMRDGRHLDPSTQLADGDQLNVSTSPMRD